MGLEASKRADVAGARTMGERARILSPCAALGSASDLLHLCAEVLDARKTCHGRCYGLGFVRAASALRTVLGSRAITRR
jgi:hypothetical protein